MRKLQLHAPEGPSVALPRRANTPPFPALAPDCWGEQQEEVLDHRSLSVQQEINLSKAHRSLGSWLATLKQQLQANITRGEQRCCLTCSLSLSCSWPAITPRTHTPSFYSCVALAATWLMAAHGLHMQAPGRALNTSAQQWSAAWTASWASLTMRKTGPN